MKGFRVACTVGRCFATTQNLQNPVICVLHSICIHILKISLYNCIIVVYHAIDMRALLQQEVKYHGTSLIDIKSLPVCPCKL